MGALGKGVLGARETRGAREEGFPASRGLSRRGKNETSASREEEGGRETPARKPLFFSFLTSTRRMLKS